jgi:hypothetical protein
MHSNTLSQEYAYDYSYSLNMGRKRVLLQLSELVFFFDSFEPCFPPKVKAGSVTTAEFGSIAQNSFEYHSILHFPQLAIGLEQYVFNVF